ncbi:MAG: RidA family protein [Lawsonibacter sp.]|jgi:enamine deaminase RidA (YjgF/YER057c/UK114 family)
MSQNPVPQGNYRPAVRFGNLIYTAGMTPRKDGALQMTGKVTPDQSLETYRAAARQAAANALTAAKNCLANGEHIAQILSLTVYVNASPDYTTHAKIGDLVSEYLFEQLGDAGIGPRAAVGVATLPGNAPLEVQLIAGVG